MKIYIQTIFPKLLSSSLGPTRGLNCYGHDRFDDDKTITRPLRPYHDRAKHGSKTLSCPLPTSNAFNGNKKPNRPESQVGIVGFEEYGIPMGSISKTTQVDVRYDVENEEIKDHKAVKEEPTLRSFSTI